MVVYLLTVLLAAAAWATPLPLEDPLQTLAERLVAAPEGERAARLAPLNPADGAALIAILHRSSAALMDKGEYGKARAQTEAELAAARRFGTVPDQLKALGNHGLCLDRIGDAESALKFYREELALAEANGVKELAAGGPNQIGGASEHLGPFEAAPHALETRLPLLHERYDDVRVSTVLHQLA